LFEGSEPGLTADFLAGDSGWTNAVLALDEEVRDAFDFLTDLRAEEREAATSFLVIWDLLMDTVGATCFFTAAAKEVTFGVVDVDG
jgi:hypothetical protein